jgi:hypothetical protein
MDFIVFAVPVVTTVIMFGFKKLAGLQMFANGPRRDPFSGYSWSAFH